MTVAELIAKLQELPQDMPVYRRDASWDNLSVNDVDIYEVTESDDDDLSVPAPERKYQKLTAVVIG